MDPVLALTYDAAKSNRVKVVLEFDADAQLSDPEKQLEPYVIHHHLLSIQAAKLCSEAGEIALTSQGKPMQEVVDKVRAEKAEKLAAIEAEYAKKEAAALRL